MSRIASIFGLLTLFVFVGLASAQTPQSGQPHGITFPIAELGNCASVDACRLYCEQPANHESCIQFAQNKGFYKQNAVASAESQLGCTSLDSCRTFCALKENHQKCAEFAKTQHVSGGYTTSGKTDEEVLEFARTELGCTSYEGCMEFCEQERNMDKCMDFASRHNLGGNAAQMKEQMSTMKKLLGCNSMKACMDFCNNPANMQTCTEVFKQAGFDTGGENYANEPPEVWCPKAGVTGETCVWDGNQCTCWNPQECESYPGCKFTGNKCECSYQEEAIGTGCNQQPGCQWTGSVCECTGQDLTQYCQDNPDKCSSSQEGPPPGADPTEWCKQNPDICTNQQLGDPAAECAKYGCTFDGQTCQCPQSEEKSDFSSQCLSQPGCSWDTITKICSCATGEQPPNVQEGARQECEAAAPGCYWDGIDCRCPQASPAQVQGATIVRSLLFTILDFLF